MTKEQINIAIAEACGWKYVNNETHAPDGSFWWSKELEIPDYCNDLNAMHEAEKTLTYAQGGDMTLWIQRMTCAGYGPQLFATAAQRAEAFLKTINKWEEKP
jgi:hypothetical protein